MCFQSNLRGYPRESVETMHPEKMTVFGPFFGSVDDHIGPKKRSLCFDRFPCISCVFVFDHHIFTIFAYDFLFIFLVFCNKYSTTQQHTQHIIPTIHKSKQHTITIIQHNTTTHHLTRDT